jgi:hypothetical protein
VSVKDLIVKWEDALAQALQLANRPEVSDEDLEASQGMLLRVKAGIRAAGQEHESVYYNQIGWVCN